jgi:hypothetical protein
LPHEGMYLRLMNHKRELLAGHMKCKFLEGVDICGVPQSFQRLQEEPLLDEIGLIVCEQPRNDEDISEFYPRIVRSMLAHCGRWTCVLVIRLCDMMVTKSRLTDPGCNLGKRVSFRRNFHMHYHPCRNGHNFRAEEASWVADSFEGGEWCAIVVDPIKSEDKMHFSEWYIPQMVWEAAVVYRKRTLKTASHSMESDKAIKNHWHRQLKLHNILVHDVSKKGGYQEIEPQRYQELISTGLLL